LKRIVNGASGFRRWPADDLDISVLFPPDDPAIRFRLPARRYLLVHLARRHRPQRPAEPAEQEVAVDGALGALVSRYGLDDPTD
jgi:hypothetical protein